ncbi:helix-turn-helix domain-containing protein [Phytohabitans kaempferiae]|uniref:Helix-turn-helix domain-containing protein n=1 Tax=Phytohabitans kaempferiae TaxID=1620943 RepID=A0ABV6MEI0_9ACTN
MNTVKPALTAKASRPRRRMVVENDEFAAFARRIIRAHGKRVASGDVEALTDLVALSTLIDTVIAEAVKGLRKQGYSWQEIAARLGISRQAAQQRWGGDRP